MADYLPALYSYDIFDPTVINIIQLDPETIPSQPLDPFPRSPEFQIPLPPKGKDHFIIDPYYQ